MTRQIELAREIRAKATCGNRFTLSRHLLHEFFPVKDRATQGVFAIALALDGRPVPPLATLESEIERFCRAHLFVWSFDLDGNLVFEVTYARIARDNGQEIE